MKAKGFYLVMKCVLLLCIFSGICHAGPTLSVEGNTATLGETVEIKINVDDMSQLAAAVFSITYDSSHLTLVSVVDVTPFFNAFDFKDDPLGTIKFCGGKKLPTGLPNTPATIITLNFQALDKPDTTLDYTINLVQTTLDYPAAGYNGDPVPVLVGAAPYAILATVFEPGQLSIDRDGDGLTDTQETDLNIGLNINNPDTDGDGMGDSWEVENMPPMKPVVSDAFEDYDLDGYTNLSERLSGTDPGTPDNPGKLLADVDNNGVGDGDVDGEDLFTLANEMEANCSGSSCLCDFNKNGTVDDIDLRLFAEDFNR